MARTRSPRFDDQRDHILACAAECFAQQGYTAATMNGVAAAAGVSKATLYHYVRDKHDLLAQTTLAHVARLQAVAAEVQAMQRPPADELRELITRFVRVYADAQHAHRVLTEDVKFLADDERARVLAGQRAVVAAFARAVAALRPDLAEAALHTPLTMLLFGMINWMFTWLKPAAPGQPQRLTHDDLAPLVADLFFGGLPAVQPPRRAARPTPRPTPRRPTRPSTDPITP